MTSSIRWALPYLASGQAQKEITHNEAIAAIDRLLHPAVVSRDTLVPPLYALAGDSHIVGTDGIGTWAGRAGMIATFDGQNWTLTTPRVGCLAWIVDESSFAVFTGTGWSTGGWPAQGLRIGDRTVIGAPPVTVVAPEGGGTVDSECRVALSALIAALGVQGLIT